MPPPHHEHDHHHDHHHHHHHHHKNHHHHPYADRWWRDLPESAVAAAKVLGYSESAWDESEEIAYESKAFVDLSDVEKRAAVYLGKAPITHKFHRLKWGDIDDTTKTHAEVLGFDEHAWDHGHNLGDIECWNWWWKDTNDEQQAALAYFGYNANLWDQTGNDESFDGAPIPPSPPPKKKADDDKKDDASDAQGDTDSESDDDSAASGSGGGTAAAAAAAPAAADAPATATASKPKKKKKPKFSQTPLFGGSDGDDFDHGNNLHINEITVYANSGGVHCIEIQYNGGKECKVGTIPLLRKNPTTLKFRKGEYVTRITLHATDSVHGITFYSNRGTKLGPCGTTKGDEVELRAPPNCVLCGLKGKDAKRHVNAIGFRWGPDRTKR